MTTPDQTPLPPVDDAALREAMNRVRLEVGKAVVGQDGAITGMLIALLARGHVLLEGVPGVAKTLLVRSFSRAVGLDTKRIQFTPDLMPGDVSGSLIYDARTGEFEFREGPVFTNVVLADEINRTPPKTQSALLEAMEERQVSTDGVTRALPEPFLVAATQNPVEHEGTYALPEAQLDRFLLEIHVEYPSEHEEREIARRTTSADVGTVPRVLSAAEVRALQSLVPRIPVTDAAVQLAVSLGRATRPKERSGTGTSGVKEVDEYVRFGAGPRGSQALVLAAKARAALRGEAAADVEDVRALVVPVLRHRLVMSYRAEAEGVRDTDVLKAVLASVS